MSEFTEVKNFDMDAMHAGAALAGAKEIPGGYPYVVVPDGYNVVNAKSAGLLKPELPNHRSAQLTMGNHTSFIQYLQRYFSDDLLLLAQRGAKNGQGYSVRGILDYHPDGSDHTKANWAEHVVVLNLQTSDEWNQWVSRSGKEMPQVDFAHFIEDHLLDIVEPSHSVITAVATKLEAKRNVQFRSEYEPSNAQVKFLYDETVQGSVSGGHIEVPRMLKIKLMPFRGYKVFEFDLRLRWRLDKEKLAFFYEFIRPDAILDAVFDEIIAQIQSETAKKVLEGSIK